MSMYRLRTTSLVPQSFLFSWEFTDGRTSKMEPLGGLWKGYGRLVPLQQTHGVLNRTQKPAFCCLHSASTPVRIYVLFSSFVKNILRAYFLCITFVRFNLRHLCRHHVTL